MSPQFSAPLRTLRGKRCSSCPPPRPSASSADKGVAVALLRAPPRPPRTKGVAVALLRAPPRPPRTKGVAVALLRASPRPPRIKKGVLRSPLWPSADSFANCGYPGTPVHMRLPPGPKKPLTFFLTSLILETRLAIEKNTSTRPLQTKSLDPLLFSEYGPRLHRPSPVSIAHTGAPLYRLCRASYPNQFAPHCRQQAGAFLLPVDSGDKQ